MLKSHDTLPPGGWVYRQPETSWQSDFGRTFDETVDDIIKHRRANPRFNLATDWNVVAAELDAYTEARMRSIPGAAVYLTASDPKIASPQRPSNAPIADVAGTKPTIRGSLPVLINWLGEGLNPVDPDLAFKRADICSDCPQNGKGDWRHYFTKPVAETIHLQMEMKRGLRLRTEIDAALGVCQACLCELTLKIWVPLAHITSHMDDETRKRLDPRCWIRHES